jgi:putative ABC transport system ATP-binding protein
MTPAMTKAKPLEDAMEQPPAKGTPVLVARDIVKELGEGAGKVRALKGVSLELYPGELTLLMGPSGSGKTTLLSILGCILTSTSGHLTLVGQPTAGLKAEALADLRRDHVGFIFQGYNLFPTLSAEENVRLALDVRGQRGTDAVLRAQRSLQQVGLGHRMRAKPGNLSGGEKQRVAVARAIASQPSLILADEPTAALDSENGQSVMALLAEIAHGASHAVLAVTHDPRTIPYADRILRIEDGLIVGEDRRPGPESGDTVHQLSPTPTSRDKKRR